MTSAVIQGQQGTPLHLIEKHAYQGWLEQQPAMTMAQCH